MSRVRRRTSLLILAALCVAAPIGAQRVQPKLIVLLVVDQMRGDYVDRFEQQWTGGLHRLLTEGAWFRQVDYPYFDTLTCPGHTTIATGTLPTTHGMVLNLWWDPRRQMEVRCTFDESTSFVSYGHAVPGGGDSAANIRATTIADELRAQSHGASRVIAFSLKARAAIPLGGHHPDVVTWFDDSGAWVTSSAFTAKPVPQITQFIETHSAPPSDESLAQMALDVARQMHFERGDGTNFIGISFSDLDRVGHASGPQSPEVEETLHQLDRMLSTLLTGLDDLVGAGHYTVALVSDHGVAPVPEQMREQGLDAGRLTPAQFADLIEGVMRRVAGPGHYVAHVVNTHVYLNPGTFERLEKNGQLGAIRAGIRALPFVSDVSVRDDGADARLGEMTVVLKPYWIVYAAGAATHGTSYRYDTRVPLMLMGYGIRPGEYLAPASPLDVAPTLAFLAGITLPRAQGRVLVEALGPSKTSHHGE